MLLFGTKSVIVLADIFLHAAHSINVYFWNLYDCPNPLVAQVIMFIVTALMCDFCLGSVTLSAFLIVSR